MNEVYKEEAHGVPFISGALGTISRYLSATEDVLKISGIVGSAQMGTLPATAYVLRKVLCF